MPNPLKKRSRDETLSLPLTDSFDTGISTMTRSTASARCEGQRNQISGTLLFIWVLLLYLSQLDEKDVFATQLNANLSNRQRDIRLKFWRNAVKKDVRDLVKSQRDLFSDLYTFEEETFTDKSGHPLIKHPFFVMMSKNSVKGL